MKPRGTTRHGTGLRRWAALGAVLFGMLPGGRTAAPPPQSPFALGLYRDGELVHSVPLEVGGGRATGPAVSAETRARNAALAAALAPVGELHALLRQMQSEGSGTAPGPREAVRGLWAEFTGGEAAARTALSAEVKPGFAADQAGRLRAAASAFDERRARLGALVDDVIAGRPGAVPAALAFLDAHPTGVRAPRTGRPPTVQPLTLTPAPRLTRGEADAREGAAAPVGPGRGNRAAIMERALGSGPPAARLQTAAPPVPADTQPTIDVQITPEITAQAAELGNSALAIYEFVRNNARFEPYLGSRKGSVETLRQLAGNDTDQASLLLALLRAAGIPARYVRGSVEMTPAQARAWLGTDDTETAGAILTTAGLDGLSIVNGPDVVAVRCTRVWVEAYVPYANYRGVALDDTGKAWIPLDPAFKPLEITQGEDVLAAMGFNTDTFLTDYISAANSNSPLEQLASDQQAWLDANRPGTLLLATERRGTITGQALGLLPASLPYAVRSVSSRFSALEAGKRYTVRFHLHDGGTTFINYTISLPELITKRLTIEYVGATPADQAVIDANGSIYETPPAGLDVRPVLKLDNVVVATGAGSIGMGYTHSSDMHFTAPAGASNQQPLVQNEIIAGNGQAIAFDSFLDPADPPFDGISPPADELTEALQHPAAAGYLARVSAGLLQAGRWMRMVTLSDVSEAIVENAVKVTYSFGTPVTFEWTGLIVDADRRIIGPFSVDGDDAKNVPYMLLTGYEGSFLENRIFEDTFGEEAVSTIKILQLANDAGIGVCTITSGLAQCPGLNHNASVIAAINAALAQGHHVIIPKGPITVQEWSGTGYIDLNPLTGAAGYIISGGISGNVVVSGGATVRRWTINFGCDFTDFSGTVTKPAADSPNPVAIFCGDDTNPIELEGTVTVTCRNGPPETKDLKPPTPLPSPKEIVDNPAFGPGDYQVTLFALGQTKILRKMTLVKADVVATTPGGGTVPDDKEETDGCPLCRNDDDDDEDKKLDQHDVVITGTAAQQAEDVKDMATLKLKKIPSTLLTASKVFIKKAAGAGNVRIFKQSDKSLILTTSTSASTTDAQASALFTALKAADETYIVEGVDGGNLDLVIEFQEGTKKCEDKLKIRIVNLNAIAKYSKTSDPAETEVAEDKETDEGLFLCANDDDDDVDDKRDDHDEVITGNAAQKTADKLDLATFLLKKLEPADVPDGKVFIKKLEGDGNVRLFKAADDSHILTTSGATSSTSDAQAGALFTALKAADENYRLEGVEPGELILALEYRDNAGAVVCEDKIKVHVLRVDLDVDADRDGGMVEDAEDEKDDDKWDKTRGAIYAVNLDRDGTRTSGADPIPDAIHFDDTGSPVDEDFVIQNADDEKDLAPLVIRKITPMKIPGALKVFLKAAEVEDVQRVHVFKKIKADPANTAIWGRATGGAPPTELDITKYVNPDDAEFQGDAGTKDAEFGLEGLMFRYEGGSAVAALKFDGEVDFTIELRKGAQVLCKESVRLKVAPWIASNHEDASQEVWALNNGAGNDEFRLNASANPGYKGLSDSGQLSDDSGPGVVSQWFQDHLQFGYTQRPGGSKTHMVFRLPYDQSPANPTWPLRRLLKKDSGVFSIGNSFGANSGDYGGNLEVLPPTAAHKLGRTGLGDSSFAPLRQFLTSQEVQPAFFNLPVNWLIVAHVDEVTSFLGGGKVALADPTQAWNLIADVAKIPASNRFKTLFFSVGAVPEGGTVGAGFTNRLYDGPATGRIVTVAEGGLVDGEKFIIKSDGATTNVFEIETTNGVAAGSIAIDLSAAGASTANEVRDKIIAAVNGAGFSVKAIEDGVGAVHLWNETKGTAGNQAITETVANAGFTVTGMSGGKAGGRDFTTTAWGYVRTFKIVAAKPAQGQVARIKAGGRHDGWIEIDRVWATTSRIIGGAAPAHDIMHWSENQLVPASAWGSVPASGDKYAVCENTRFWRSDTPAAVHPNQEPAIVSVEEILADANFEALNKTDVQGVLNTLKANLNAAASGGLTFVNLPNLFFGTRAGFAAGRSAVAFNPGPTNLQPLAGRRYVPRQFGPRTAAGLDLYEDLIKSQLGGVVEFVDCWDLYHRLLGEVHCGSEVRRDFPAGDWWTNIP